MSDTAWIIAELLVNAANVSSVLWYLYRKLGTGEKPFTWVLAGGLLSFAFLSVCNFLAVPDFIRIPLLAAACVTYSLIVSGGTAGQKVFHSIVALLLVGLSDAAVIATISLQDGVTFSMILAPTAHRLQAMIWSKLLLLYLAFLFSRKRSQEINKATQWIMIVSVPTISMAILTILMQYGQLWNGQKPYGIIAAALGLFIMNAVLLALHGRLSANTRLLVEKEKMLQQSELQNRYFSETLAANDNIQGFKHDLKNHLQVLNGYLEMNSAGQAKDYLNQIGSFISRNDFSINCGYPLVDAVLGSKIAIARKQGIQVDHVVNLAKDIGMEQMDLCSILGNTMDNALEACARMGTEHPCKSISIELVSRGGAICLIIANSTEAACNGGLRTNKPGNGHGIGLAIVRKTVEKYRGTMEVAHSGGQFRVMITIPNEIISSIK